MGMEKCEAGTPIVRVQDGSEGPTGLKPRSASSVPGMKRRTIVPAMVLGAQLWFAESTACRSLVFLGELQDCVCGLQLGCNLPVPVAWGWAGSCFQ